MFNLDFYLKESMKFKIIKVKDLDIKCWSSLRYLGKCKSCEKFAKCKISL
jgi:hypothetical protein